MIVSPTSNSTDSREIYSGGWNLLYLFNPKRGGLDIGPSTENNEEDRTDELKMFDWKLIIVPLYLMELLEYCHSLHRRCLRQCQDIRESFYLLGRPCTII